jgi:hypothetical protein
MCSLFIQSLPMTIFHCIFFQNSDDRKQGFQVFNGSLQLFVSLPLFEIFRKLDTLVTVFLAGFLHSIDFIGANIHPKHFLKGCNFSNNFRVEVIELLQISQLSFSLFKSGIFLMLQSE